jgi:acyl-CoA reductase-like NAD-dependent aldehyde dehydrogenase
MQRGQNLQRLAAIAAQTFRYYTGWCDKPEGVINVVPGFGHTAGAALSGQPDVD